jgi:hypothetical protein
MHTSKSQSCLASTTQGTYLLLSLLAFLLCFQMCSLDMREACTSFWVLQLKAGQDLKQRDRCVCLIVQAIGGALANDGKLVCFWHMVHHSLHVLGVALFNGLQLRGTVW